MIRSFSFFVPGHPKAKMYKQTKFGVVYTKGDVKQWERTVAQYAQVAAGAGWKKMFGRVNLQLSFLFDIPKSRKEVVNYDPHLQDPDLTNLLKATEDGLKTVLFSDDNLVWNMTLTKRWCSPGKEGVRVMVEIDGETDNQSDAT